jgi:ABC-type sugar transport system permease subunit
MKRSLLRIVLLVMAIVLFKYIVPKSDFLLRAFIIVWAIEHLVYYLLWRINLDQNTGQPKG